jgi:hypothetical protein
VAILALILSHGTVQILMWIGQAGLWVAVITAVASAADYFRRFSLFSRNDVIARDDRVA